LKQEIRKLTDRVGKLNLSLQEQATKHIDELSRKEREILSEREQSKIAESMVISGI